MPVEQPADRAANLPSLVDFPFAHRQRVRFGETDLQGVVYYANYLLFAEVGRIAFLRQLGVVYERDLLAHGVDFTIGEARVRYQAPLRFDDEYDIKVRVGEMRHTSWTNGPTVRTCFGSGRSVRSAASAAGSSATSAATRRHARSL